MSQKFCYFVVVPLILSICVVGQENQQRKIHSAEIWAWYLGSRLGLATLWKFYDQHKDAEKNYKVAEKAAGKLGLVLFL